MSNTSVKKDTILRAMTILYGEKTILGRAFMVKKDTIRNVER